MRAAPPSTPNANNGSARARDGRAAQLAARKAAAAAGISFVDLLAEIYQASLLRRSAGADGQSDSDTAEKSESGEVRHGA